MRTTTSTQKSATNQHAEPQNLRSAKTSNAMKKLSNVSPFLLLLMPVFVMMIYTFSISVPANENESTLKTAAGTAGSIVNISVKILK